jgi:hypothetical protein
MSVEQIEATLMKLPREERRQFADWFYQHENEILDPRDDDKASPAVRDELELRLKEINEHPEILEPFEEEDLERMIQKAADAHAKACG